LDLSISTLQPCVSLIIQNRGRNYSHKQINETVTDFDLNNSFISVRLHTELLGLDSLWSAGIFLFTESRAVLRHTHRISNVFWVLRPDIKDMQKLKTIAYHPMVSA